MTLLVAQLTSLFNKDREHNEKISAFLASYKDNQDPANKTLESGLDPLYILVIAIQKANAANTTDFLSISQLDVKEPKTYKQAMSRPHAQ